MTKNVVIACGMQRAYFHESGNFYLKEKAEVLKVRLIEYFKSLNRNDTIIFFTKEIHQTNDSFYRETKTYGIVGSQDIEIPEVFKPYSNFIVNVNRYNAFYKTALESELIKIKPAKVFVVGVETHTNVLFTAEELRNRDYDVTVYEALVASEDDFMHEAGINLMSNTISVMVNS
jgi:nicotinamidase-related amidase